MELVMERGMPSRRPSLALVSMPFVSAWRPSIQIGTLTPVVRAAGFPVRPVSAYLDFAALIGPDRYELLTDFGRQPVGDWLFSGEAFRADAPDPDGERILADETTQHLLRGLGWDADALRCVRNEQVPRYLDWLLRLLPWGNIDVLGLTTTFQQNCASLALARRVKEQQPEVVVVMGGSNVDGDMGLELLRIAPWIDCTVTGEGERTLPELLRAIEERRPLTDVPGVAGHCGETIRPAVHRIPTDRLDELPVPDYDEYFTRTRALRLDGRAPYEIRLPFESSRGCWWGAKHHCTFCGLNGSTMAYRSKSATRTRSELGELSRRHAIRRFDAVDNILATDYLRTLLPGLKQEGAPFTLFFEIKANLDEDQIALLAAAGVEEVQPGIESLSTRVLALMDKGVTAAQNIETMRRLHGHGLIVRWNVLYGFPGERPEDYDEQVALMRHLHHLPPPESVGRIWLERFSPLYMRQQAFGVQDVRASQAYHSIYPAGTAWERIAYFFDYDLADALPESAYQALHDEVECWKAEWRNGPPELTVRCVEGAIVVHDSRGGRPRSYELVDDEAEVFLELHRHRRSPAALAVRTTLPSDIVDRHVRSLRDKGVVVSDGRSLVTVAVDAHV